MFLTETKQGQAVVWTLSRPDRMNGLSNSIAAEFRERLTCLKADLERDYPPVALVLRAKILPGKKAPVWIAGGDLKEMSTFDRASASHFSQIWSQICENLIHLSIPVVTVIDGHAIGGGAEFALFSDIRIGTMECSFDFRQLTVGLATGFGGAQRLKTLVGLSLAQKWLYLAKSVPATELLDRGLLHILCKDAADVEAELSRLIGHFSRLSPVALMAQKMLLQEIPPLNEAMFEGLWHNKQHLEFLDSFLKKMDRD